MAVEGAPSYAELQREVARLKGELAAAARDELAEAPAEQATTGEILRVISSSPTGLESMLQAVVDNAGF